MNIYKWHLQRFRSHVLSLLGRLFYGLAKRFGIVDDGFELRISQHPQKVIQNKKQF